ncbi:MAG TPA: flagellar biosynthetic protein FliQ [Phycisphaerales bacterium]|nr:flagellar biosynthetic protein FliQ [Phycisphaerales bacterium]
MNTSEILDCLRHAMTLTLLLGAPVLLAGLVIALAVSVFQAATQVQEQMLSFVPRILVMLLTLLLTGPWMLARLVEFSREMFGQLP